MFSSFTCLTKLTLIFIILTQQGLVYFIFLICTFQEFISKLNVKPSISKERSHFRRVDCTDLVECLNIVVVVQLAMCCWRGHWCFCDDVFTFSDLFNRKFQSYISLQHHMFRLLPCQDIVVVCLLASSCFTFLLSAPHLIAVRIDWLSCILIVACILIVSCILTGCLVWCKSVLLQKETLIDWCPRAWWSLT